MPRRLISNRIFEVILAVTVLYWAIAPFMARYLVFEIVNSLLLSISLGIVVAFTPGAWRSMRMPWDLLTASHFITVGIWLFWLVEAMQRLWSLIFRALGFQAAMAYHLWLGYLLVMSIVAGIFHIIVKEPSDLFPRSNWRNIGIIVAISLMMLLVGIRIIGYEVPS